MTCFRCKGSLENKLTNHVVNLEDCIIIVKNVPAEVCSQCGETYYSDGVAEQLEKIVTALKGLVTEIAVVNYSDKTA
jgi:YgiT-type zinc finger domain-containing protein